MSIDIRGMAPLIYVFDMPKSLAFYRDVLGFKLVTTSAPEGSHFDWCMLEYHGGQFMLNTAYDRSRRPPNPDAARTAAHRDTCFYFACPDPDAAYEHVRAKNIAAKPPEVSFYGMKQLYIKDPDGYELCFRRPSKQAAYDDWAARYNFPPRIVEEA
jgi:glyoxylase I family protein